MDKIDIQFATSEDLRTNQKVLTGVMGFHLHNGEKWIPVSNTRIMHIDMESATKQIIDNAKMIIRHDLWKKVEEALSTGQITVLTMDENISEIVYDVYGICKYPVYQVVEK